MSGRTQFTLGTGAQWYISRISLGTIVIFLIFVNDVDGNIKSILLKFAVDTKVFAKVNNMADRQRLQDDLNELCDWAKT